MASKEHKFKYTMCDRSYRANDQKCRAKKAKCTACRYIGHYANFYRNKNRQKGSNDFG